MNTKIDFVGMVYAANLPEGRAQATLDGAVEGVVATLQDGQRLTIPYEELNLELGGNLDAALYCKNADRSITIYTGDLEFLRSLATGLHTATADKATALLSTTQRKQFLGRTTRWTLALVFGLLVVSVPFWLGPAVESTIKSLPTSVDEEIGAAGMKQLDVTRIEDPVVDAAMQEILARLEPHIPAGYDDWDFRVMVVQDDSINAFALPGGQMVFHSGLLSRAGSAEEVAGVLAHEMAHVLERHGLQRIGQSLGIIAGLGLLFGDTGSLVGASAEYLTMAMVNKYSRDDESDADAISVAILHHAGLDPKALSAMFERMKAEDAELPASLHWISTHPSHDHRIESIADQVAELPARERKPLDIDWAAVHRALNK